MSDLVNDWHWDDSKVHPAIRYPSDGSTSVKIAMVDSFSPRTTTPKNIINSLNRSNQGLADMPHEYYVDIDCKPYGDGFAVLTQLQNNNRYFDIILQSLADYSTDGTETNDNVGIGDDAWGPQYEVYGRAKVLDQSSSYAKEGDIPSVTFNCRALRKTSFGTKYGDGVTERTQTDTGIFIDEDDTTLDSKFGITTTP